MTVQDWRPLRRQARRRIATRAVVTVAVALPSIVAITCLFIVPADARLHRLATDLEDHGVSVVVDAVEVRDFGKYSRARATFDDGTGGTVTAELHGASPSWSDGDNAWSPATASTGYGGPLTVVYLPSDPTAVMATADVDHYGDENLVRDDVAVGAVCALPLLMTSIVWLARGRPRWWRYFDRLGEPCWYCAHPKADHSPDRACTVQTRSGACACRRYHWHRPSRAMLGR